MRKPILAILAVILASLACTQAVVTPTPVPASPTQPEPSPVPSATATREASEDVQTSAVVRAALVNVRAEPGGEVVGQVEAGTDVLIIGTDESGDWVQIEAPAGWLWGGCLEDFNEKGCLAE